MLTAHQPAPPAPPAEGIIPGTNDRMVGPRGANPGEAGARHHGIHLTDPGSCEVPSGYTITRGEWDRQQQPVPVVHERPTFQPDTNSKEDPEMGRRRLVEEQRGFNAPRASRQPSPRPLTHTVGDAISDFQVEAVVAAAYDEYHERGMAPMQTIGRKPAEGRFIAVQEGRPYKGTTYHLFADCGRLTGPMAASATEQRRERGEATDLTPWHVREASDELIEVLALKICSHCDNRTKLLTLEDVLELWIREQHLIRNAVSAEQAKRVRRQLVHHLAEYGFAIRQVHKQQPHLRTTDEESPE